VQYNIDHLREHFGSNTFKFVKLKSRSKIWRLAVELPTIIYKGKYDYAHFQYVVPFIKKCKYINTIHDLLFLEFKQFFPWYYRMINGTLFKTSSLLTDILLTVSNYSKQEIAKKFNIDPSQILVTPNGINVGVYDQATSSKAIDNKYILYVSRFEPRKNHKSLLDAYLNLRLYEQGYDLVFVGSKKAMIELQAFNDLVKSIPPAVSARVRFFEHLSPGEIMHIYQNASCFVFPSLAEGFGIPPLEAANHNCKVLCSNSTAMQDFDFFKYRYDPYDQSQLESQLTMLLNDNFYPYEEIRNEILNRYNWDLIAEVLHKKLI
jgi:glycosyltransferase involved in cell wall biosynthesis